MAIQNKTQAELLLFLRNSLAITFQIMHLKLAEHLFPKATQGQVTLSLHNKTNKCSQSIQNIL
jgi:hypothetical protein